MIHILLNCIDIPSLGLFRNIDKFTKLAIEQFLSDWVSWQGKNQASKMNNKGLFCLK
ncbi:hypothetical protein N474_24430 [Pseudoalteromonas luteoviolacea CPMOR-2]|uniref:Uncharacterized protein n=1 Tax=Pseudoalteromonas luteoviolacea DSM 6061 TaxID=1365250 RepID=A0A166VH64_9GAMM|nr:hypothetical protein N475_21430 [Pseudoalteromonas luteoviolacea DSM 6061]KZN50845.1 hypothetical protein N474_24430 [Pseudoalteromonas luteoviolacea CPMOR-2]MBE0387115.1 hypothetical protein [Pseudoalteromonas luteoviolacea DSM 6061]